MKKIALDLDGVVFDSETLYRVYAELYDVNVLKGNNLIDNTLRRAQERYNWDENVFNKFMNLYRKEVVENSNLMPGIGIVLNELLKHYEFIIITARTDEEVEWSKKVLEKIGLGDVKIINNDTNKIAALMKENCDYIIEDNLTVCKEANEKGIKSIFFRNSAFDMIYDDNIKVVNNWGEIYRYLMLEKED